MISYGRDSLPISAALGGWNVGLSPKDDGSVEVWFAKLLIGHINPQTASFHPIIPKSPHRHGRQRQSFWPSPLRSKGQKDLNSHIDYSTQKL